MKKILIICLIALLAAATGVYAAGKGFHNFQRIKSDRSVYGDLANRIEDGDFSIFNKRIW